MSMKAFHAKRKETDDLVTDLLKNVSISPTKKVRVGDSWAPSNIFQLALFEPSKEAHVSSPVALEPPVVVPPPAAPHIATASPVPTVVPGVEQKASVLCRPPTGSSDLLIKVNAAGYPAAIKGTDSNGFCSDDAGLPSSADALCGAGLFEALDLQGGPSSEFSSRRLQRVLSCSSLPPVVTALDKFQAVADESDPQTSSSTGSQTVFRPWAPPAFPAPGTDNLSPTVLGMMTTTPIDKSVTHLGDEEEMVNIEPMDVMEGNTTTTTANGEAVSAQEGLQFGSPIPTFGSSQWGTSEMLKAPYSKVMWSH